MSERQFLSKLLFVLLLASGFCGARNTRAEAAPQKRFVLFPQPGGKYRLPTHFHFLLACGVTAGSKDGDTTLAGNPLAGTASLRGLNLSVASDDIQGCAQIQVLFANDSLTDAALARLTPDWTIVRPPTAEAANPDRTVHDLFDMIDSGGLANLQQVSHVPAKDGPGATWYFAASEGLEQALEVSVPAIAGKKYVCIQGKTADKFTFQMEQDAVDLQISSTPDQCDDSHTELRHFQRLSREALLLSDAEKADLKVRLVPYQDSTSDVGVELKGKYFSDPDFRATNSVAVDEFRLKGVSCDSDSCTYRLSRPTPLARAERSFKVSLDSRGIRALWSGERVFDKTGQLQTLGKAYAPVVATWNLGQSKVFIQIADQPDSTTAIAIPSFIARLLTPTTPLTCGGTPCARFASNNDGGYVTIFSADSLKKLAGAARPLDIELGSSDKIVLQSNDPTVAVDLSLLTDDCRFTFQQLTQTFTGLQGGQTLFLAQASPSRCLCGDLHLESLDQAVVIKSSQYDDTATADCREKPPNARALRVAVDSSEQPPPAAKTYALQAHFGVDTGSDVVKLASGGSFPIRVTPGISAHDFTLNADLWRTADGTSALAGQPHLAAGAANRVNIARVANVPWQLELTRLDNYAAQYPDVGAAGTEIEVSLEPRGLHSALVKGSDSYFIRAAGPSEDDFALAAGLVGVGSDFSLQSDAALPAGAANVAAAVLTKPLSPGFATVTFQGVKTRRFFVPWNLKNASLVCNWDGTSLPIPRGVQFGDATRPLKLDEYRNCWLSFQPDAGVSAADYRDRSLQRVKVTIAKTNTSDTPTLVTMVRETDVKLLPQPAAASGANPIQSTAVVVQLGSLLDKLGDVPNYTNLTVHVANATDTDLGPDLANYYQPVGMGEMRDSMLDARTILVPWASVRFGQGAGGDTKGIRFYPAATAKFSVVRSRNNGLKATTSSTYDSSVTADFGYGLLGVMEPWNFSQNQPILPFFAPQLNLGVLGPTSFGSNWLNGFSIVGGVNLRLPAASDPSGSKAESQSGLIVWYEVSHGERDSVIQSLLFGFNVSISP